METVIKSIFLWTLYLAGLAIYVFLIAEIIPKYLLKVSGDANRTLGRGLKKFVYPDGRAVVYEPHPSIRKYVKKYALFTLDGYKYVQMCAAPDVKNYVARVTMYNNQNKIIDCCDIIENRLATNMPSPVKLHENTSYIALSLLEVNRVPLTKLYRVTMHMRDTLVYFLLVSFATFFQFIHFLATFKGTYGLFDMEAPIKIGYAFFIVPSLIIGIVCLVIMVVDKMRNGVKVVFK